MTFRFIMIRQQFHATHVAVKIGTLALCANLVMFLTGFTTTSWNYSKFDKKRLSYYDKLGLWEYCRCFSGNDVTDDACLCIKTIEHFETAWFRGVQACEVIALGCHTFAIVAAIIFIMILKHSIVKWTTIWFIIGAGVFTTAGVLVYAVKTPEPADLHVSFYVTMASAVCTFLIAGMMSYGASDTMTRTGNQDTGKLWASYKIKPLQLTNHRQLISLKTVQNATKPKGTMLSESINLKVDHADQSRIWNTSSNFREIPSAAGIGRSDTNEQSRSLNRCHGSDHVATICLNNEAKVADQIPPDYTEFPAFGSC